MNGRGAAGRRQWWLAVAAAVCVATAALGQQKVRPQVVRPVLTSNQLQGIDPTVTIPLPAELAAVEIDPVLDAIVDALGDSSYAAREAANAQLIASSLENLQLYAVLARRELTAEQRHRLLSALRERLLNTPRGAVGIKVDQRWRRENKVVVEDLLPDLPAREVLQVGDRITHLEGEPLESWIVFVRAVQSKVPGAKITFTVERLVSGRRPQRRDVGVEAAPDPKYETFQVELELGSADLLRDPITGRPPNSGPILDERRAKWKQTKSAYAPLPKVLKIDER